MQKSETTRMDEEVAELDESIKRHESAETAAGKPSTTLDRCFGPPTRIGQPSPRGQASSLGYSVARAEKRVQREHLACGTITFVSGPLFAYPTAVDEADIEPFAKLYPVNARPLQKRDLRFILSSGLR